ncbi:MAG: 1-phosphofructokinase family hexose kinase [Xanthobacteraceae bacterium]|nr:1-phosphofructokinase family hexose kinase [Xanthobacteraceae bacterium]
MATIAALCMNPAIDVSTFVERMLPTRKLRCAAVRRDPGGGGINVARVVRRLGGTVTAVYPGGGATGELLRRLVEQEGIDSRVLPAMQETREDFTVLETATGNQYRFVMPGPMLSEREWHSCLDRITSIGPAADYIVASGSLPPGVPADFYALLARAARKRGAKLILDTSGPALEAGLNEGVFLVKPSLRELSELVRKPIDEPDAWIEVTRTLVAAGCAEMVALTLGEKGALLATRDSMLQAEALAVNPVSTVGAGDSFLGAMAWSLARGDGAVRAFRYANAAGAAAVLAPGTELCRAEAVERLERSVVVHTIHNARYQLRESAGGEPVQ